MKTYLLLFLFLCLSMKATAQNDYDTQRGIELYNQKDYYSAVSYLQRAAKAGSLPALDYLGTMYAHGRGVTQDIKIAINLYQKGIDNNYAPCLVAMGRLYENATSVEKAPATAYSYYLKAANLGYGGGQLEVSLCKKYGFGTEVNPQEAFQYAVKAADNGWSYEYLADMYYEGFGTDINYAKAYEWYTKPNCTYSDKAKLRKATMLFAGQGVTKNSTMALTIINDLKKNNSTEEGIDEWYRKIKAEAQAEEYNRNIVTTPVFTEAVHKYIKNYPSPRRPAIESAGRGEIVIACTVNSIGRIENARIKYRVLVPLDEAALALVQNMPTLTPGTRGGHNADISVEIGVSFFPTKVRFYKCYR